MKVLFTHSYILAYDAKQLALSKPYPPLGTLLAMAMVRQAGHQVLFFDASFISGPEEIYSVIEHEKPDFLVVYDDGFNYLTKMCLTNMREAAFAMMQHAAALNIKTIVSSSDSTDQCDLYLDNGADVVILGEAEKTLLDLLESNSLSGIDGIAFKSGEEVQTTLRRPAMKELDELPLPAWDLLNITPYREAWKKHGYFSINIATTRGCPYHCNWCAKPIYGNRYNARSPRHVLEELFYIRSLFHFDHIWFCDDIFGLKPNWVERFGELIARSGMKFTYKIQARADLLLKGNTIEALADSGCDEVWIGAESGSQKILDAMDKGITVGQIEQSCQKMKDAGLKPCLFLQYGYPGETMEDIEMTFDMLLKIMPHDIGISVSYPLPGTGFYEKVKGELKDKANWSDSDELLLMFSNNYSPGFYKTLHRYTHVRYREAQGLLALRNEGANSRKLYRAASYFYYRPLGALLWNKLKRQAK